MLKSGLLDKSDYQPIIQKYSKTTTTYPCNTIFVYGEQVDDFIFTIATLETQLASVLTRLDALESA